MLKGKKIATGFASSAVTAAVLLGAVMPGVVLADEVTILSEGFEGKDIVSSGWSCEYYTDSYDWPWMLHNSEELSETSDGLIKEAYNGEKAAQIQYCDSGIETYRSLLITPTLDLSSYTSASISFYYVNPLDDYNGSNEMLSLWYCVDGGEWMPVTAFSDGDEAHKNWTPSGKIALPDDVLTKNVQIGFCALAADGYGIAIDDVTVKGEKASAPAPAPAPAGTVKLTGGKAHVQDIGDVSVAPDSSGVLTIGTTGQGKRLEAITIDFSNTTSYSGTLQYRVHVQDIGWMDWVDAGQLAGTQGKAKRIEAIELRLTGDLASQYSVLYCVHIQDYGDMQGWVKDGALAGTTGESKRIEELKIKIVPTGSDSNMSVMYRVHVQDFGWEGAYASNGKLSGTSGQAKRLEGIEIFLSGCQYQGGIKYKTHVQNIGWESSWSKDGEMSGTQGMSYRLEGICIELYGEVADYYDVYYRVHAEDIGWLSWACNGEPAGTAGRSARLEAIQIVLVPKGGAVPGETYEGITADSLFCFVEGFGDAVG